MSYNTKIQWCDSTVNPVMGCDGCELWPTPGQVRKAVLLHLEERNCGPVDDLERQHVAQTIREAGGLATDLYHRRHDLAAMILNTIRDVPATRKARESLARAIADPFRCYAGILHTRHGRDDGKPDKRTNSGYAEKFERPKLFPGRMAEAARWRDLSGACRPEKPWLDGLPRLIFVSDMGDALSRSVTFDYLHDEIVPNVTSVDGRRHLWLWLTKRPGRMAEFSEWLEKRGVPWPENLVAMTSVTSRKTIGRIDQLRRVKCRYRGLSIEPLWEEVEPDLDGIDWIIVGGESGGGALPFDLAWARSLRDRCHQQGVAFFVKQLGAFPAEHGRAVALRDAHGGDWSEWPEDLRVREFPADWTSLAQGGFSDEEGWLEFDLRRIAIHEAAHAVVAWEFGELSEIHLQKEYGNPEVQTIVSGRRIQVRAQTRELQQWAEAAQRHFEATGEFPAPQPIDEPFVTLSPRQLAAVGVAGAVAELMLSAQGESVTADELIEFIEESPLSPSDWESIDGCFPDPVNHPGIPELVAETSGLLHERWHLVEGLADRLGEDFHDDGEVFLSAEQVLEEMTKSRKPAPQRKG